MQAQTTATPEPTVMYRAAAPPDIFTPLSPAEVVARLDVASRRGRLPGFQRLAPDVGLFQLELHGRPFDGVLTVTAAPHPAEGTRLHLHARMLPQMPAIFAIILIATVWPGVYFMDRLIPGDWTWIPQVGQWWPATWWWYIPLTALPLPPLWRTLMRRSRAGLDDAVRQAIEKITRETEGRVQPASTPR